MLKAMNHWAWTVPPDLPFVSDKASPLCVELWAYTSTTEYQLNEAFEDLVKNLIGDILKDLNELF